MKVTSWNVQGLGGPFYKRMRGRLRLELQKALIGDPIDILLFEEHHLCQRRIDGYGSILRGQWMTCWSPRIGNNGAYVGVCMAISTSWKDNALSYVDLRPGRAQYIIISIKDEIVGVLNIYAPNSVSERIVFWNQLEALCPSNINWCVGGDFNMIDRVKDRTGGSMTTIHGQELACWERLCCHLHILDAWTVDTFMRMHG